MENNLEEVLEKVYDYYIENTPEEQTQMLADWAETLLKDNESWDAFLTYHTDRVSEED